MESPEKLKSAEDGRKGRQKWGVPETKLLIALRVEASPHFSSLYSYLKNKKDWEGIAEKMKEKGYEREAPNCFDKWKTLCKQYKEVCDHNRHVSGGARKSMDFEDEMADAIGDRPLINPEFVVDSLLPGESETEQSSPPKKKKKESAIERLLKIREEELEERRKENALMERILGALVGEVGKKKDEEAEEI